MMRLLTCLALLLSASAAAAQGQQQPRPISLTTPLVADLSQNTVEIQSNFNGAQLLVFGARNAPGDLVVAVRGPDSKVMLRRKERIAGMWMHVEQRKYLGVPAFYAIASTRPLDQIIDPHLRDALGLGEASVTAFANNVPNPLFDSALQETLMRKRWWQLPFARITYFGESLFTAPTRCPAAITRRKSIFSIAASCMHRRPFRLPSIKPASKRIFTIAPTSIAPLMGSWRCYSPSLAAGSVTGCSTGSGLLRRRRTSALACFQYQP